MAPSPANMSANAGFHSVALQYTESSRIVVEGIASRRRYEFSAASPVQIVDGRDAAELLRTRFFRLRS